MGDQNDHARRIVQLGVGLTIKPVRFTINEAIAVLSTLLSNQDIRYEAMRIGAFIAAEDAPAAATSFIAQELRRHADAKAVCKHGQPLRGGEASLYSSLLARTYKRDRLATRIFG
jgi:hypothetical protein